MRVRWAGAIALSIASFGMSAAGSAGRRSGRADRGVAEDQTLALARGAQARLPARRRPADQEGRHGRRRHPRAPARRGPACRGCSSSAPTSATSRRAAARSGPRVPASAIRTIATWGDVERVDPAAQATTMRIGGKATTKEERGGERRGRCGAPPRRSSPRAIAAHGADTVVAPRPRDRHRREGLRALRRRRLARRLAGRRRAARRRRRAARPGGRRRRGHRDARDRPRHRAGRRARLRHRLHERRELRRQHPRAALRARAATSSSTTSSTSTRARSRTARSRRRSTT